MLEIFTIDSRCQPFNKNYWIENIKYLIEKHTGLDIFVSFFKH